MATETAVGTGPFVVVQDLSKRFGARWALARASFSVERGNLVLLTGANGSGKTTLLRCLSTSLVPDFGLASVGGKDLVTERDDVRRRRHARRLRQAVVHGDHLRSSGRELRHHRRWLRRSARLRHVHVAGDLRRLGHAERLRHSPFP